jgi:hypothetical protein
MKMPFRFAAAIAAIGLAAAAPAHALPATYTFSGIASGTLFDAAGAPTDFVDQLFTIVLTGDTADVQPDVPDDGFYRLFGLGGSFSEGAFNAMLSPSVAIVANANAGFDTINFFNGTFDNGLGFWLHPALDGYDLTTSIGPLTVPSAEAPLGFLSPTLNVLGHGFALEGGGAVEFTANSSLTFTARVGRVPEPATTALVLAGVAGLVLARRRRKGD